MLKSKYRKNYGRVNSEKEYRALFGAPLTIRPQSTLLPHAQTSMAYYNPQPLITYPNASNVYYPNSGATALISSGGIAPIGYPQYFYQYNTTQQYPYNGYRYGQAVTYGGANYALPMQPSYYPSQISYRPGYQRRRIDPLYDYGPRRRRSYGRRWYDHDLDDYDYDYDYDYDLG